MPFLMFRPRHGFAKRRGIRELEIKVVCSIYDMCTIKYKIVYVIQCDGLDTIDQIFIGIGNGFFAPPVSTERVWVELWWSMSRVSGASRRRGG